MLARLWSTLRGLLGRRRFEDAMAEELRFHIERRTEDLVRSGVPPAEAARRARLELGSLDGVRDDCREARGLRLFDELRQDIRQSLRLMRKAPVFTGAVVVSLGLGIGANAAIFSLIDAVLRALPVRAPEELYFLAHGDGPSPNTSSNYPMLERYREGTTVFSGITAYSQQTFKVTEAAVVDLVPGQYVSGNYHAVIGVPFLLGRGFASEPDEASDASPIAVISEAFWTQKLGRDPSVIGKTLIVEGLTATVVGVTARTFAGLVPGTRMDITLPLSVQAAKEPAFLTRHDGWTSLPLVGRLRPGVRQAEAWMDVERVFQRFMAEPENRWAREQRPDAYRAARLVPAGRGSDGLRTRYTTALRVLLLLVAIVLLIACANVANLLLARAAGRAREVAIRLCIGGGRPRLIRQFLTESTLLAAAGGACGLLFATWGTRALVSLLQGGSQSLVLDARPNVRVLAITGLVSLAVGLIVGLLPALRASRIDLTPALKESAAIWGRARYKASTGRLIVVAQVALSVVVAVLAALLGQSLHNLRTVETGFQADRLLLFSIDTRDAPLPEAQRRSFYPSLVDRLLALPGALSASASTMSPIHTSGAYRGLEMPGLPNTPEARGAWHNAVMPGYFETFHIGVASGRVFTRLDGGDGRKVAVVNQAMARFYFGERDPLGREIRFMSAPDEKIAIVGVVRDVRQESLRAAPPRMVYTPIAQAKEIPSRLTVELRTAQDPLALAPEARAIVTSLAPGALVTAVRTMEQQIDASLVRERALATLSMSFGVLALLLACVGLYALVSYDVSRRAREIGIRLALGATRISVLGVVLRETLLLSATGIVLGTLAALGASQAVATLLFGMAPRDPATLLSVAAVLVATTLLGACREKPNRALGNEASWSQ